MGLHISDPETEDVVRDLARTRGTSLTEAVKTACRDALKQERRKIPVVELLADLHAKVRAYRKTGEKADKAFFDELWGEND
jgi:antitoxin VapB